MPPLNDNTCGHLINHPPKGMLPNVKSHTFCYRDYLEYITGAIGGAEKENIVEVVGPSERARELELIDKVHLTNFLVIGSQIYLKFRQSVA